MPSMVVTFVAAAVAVRVMVFAMLALVPSAVMHFAMTAR